MSGPSEEGGGATSTYPFEIWHYRYIEGIGENVDLEFVDTCQCGDYHFTIDRSEKDALKYVPGAGLTQYEQMNNQDKTDRFKGGGIEQLGNGPMGTMEQGKEFDRIELAAKVFAPPPIKFKDLERVLSSEHKMLSGPPFPFDVRTDFVKVTDSMDLVPITMQICEPRHHVCDQGRRVKGRGQYPGQGDHDHATRRCRPSKTRWK